MNPERPGRGGSGGHRQSRAERSSSRADPFGEQWVDHLDVGAGRPQVALVDEGVARVLDAALGEVEAAQGPLIEEGVGAQRDRRQHRALLHLERVPGCTECLPVLGEELLDRLLPELRGRCLVAGCPLPEMMGQHHRPLRVARREIEQRTEDRRDVPPAGLESGADVVGEVRIGEGVQAQGPGLAEERPLAGAEELLHQARMGAGEDVAGGVTVALDATAEEAVDLRIDGEECLKLVEGDEGPLPAAVEQRQRQVEKTSEDAGRFLGGLELRLDLGRHRSPANAHPRPQGADRGDREALRRRAQLVVGLLDPGDDVGVGEHAVEIDLDVVEADPLGVAGNAVKEARLAVTARRRQASRVPALGEVEELFGLAVAVDHVLWLYRPVEDEWIDIPHEFGIRIPNSSVVPN